MTRTGSQQARSRGQYHHPTTEEGKGPTSPSVASPPTPSSPRPAHTPVVSTVRPSFSFANAAAAKKEQAAASGEGATPSEDKAVEEATEKLADASV